MLLPVVKQRQNEKFQILHSNIQGLSPLLLTSKKDLLQTTNLADLTPLGSTSTFDQLSNT